MTATAIGKRKKEKRTFEQVRHEIETLIKQISKEHPSFLKKQLQQDNESKNQRNEEQATRPARPLLEKPS